MERLDFVTSVLYLRAPTTTSFLVIDKGLALFNLAAVERNALRRSITTHQHNKLILLEGTPRRLDDLLSRTHDTWVVLYYDSAKTPNIIDGRSDWSRLEHSLHGVANVAIFDLAGQYTEVSSDEIAREADYEVVYADPTYIATSMQTHRTVYEVDALHRYQFLPMVKVHLGDARAPTAGFSFAPDIAGQPWEGDVHDGSAIEAAVRTEMAKRNRSTGSIATVSVALQHRFLEALVYMRYELPTLFVHSCIQCITLHSSLCDVFTLSGEPLRLSRCSQNCSAWQPRWRVWRGT